MITEDQLEQLCLEWFQALGYAASRDISWKSPSCKLAVNTAQAVT